MSGSQLSRDVMAKGSREVHSSGSHAEDVLAFVLPLALVVKVGSENLYLSDLLVLTLFPALVLRSSTAGRLRAPLPMPIRRLLLLGWLWLSAQVGTDLVHHVAALDMLRGWSRIVLLLLAIPVLARLLATEQRCLLFVIGLIAAQVFNFVFAPSVFAVGDPWKFGIGLPVTLVMIVVGCHLWRHRRHRLAVVLFAGLAVLHLALGFRSQAGITALAGVSLAFIAKEGRGAGSGHRGSATRTVALSAGAILLVVLGIQVYAALATHGDLGEAARQKYLNQTTSGQGLLLASRFETRPSLAAIADAPLFGHGSNARDPRYVAMLPEPARTLQTLAGDDRIPTHSHILGAWVDGGLLGAIFWLYAAYLCVRALMRALVAAVVAAPLVVYLVWNALWDIGFSPFAAERHFTVAFVLVVVGYAGVSRAAPRDTAPLLSVSPAVPSGAGSR